MAVFQEKTLNIIKKDAFTQKKSKKSMNLQENFSQNFLAEALCDHSIDDFIVNNRNSKAKFRDDINLRKAKDFYLDHIEDIPFVMENKKDGMFKVKSKKNAVARYPWIQHNRDSKIRNFVIDIDNNNWQEMLDRGLLPLPNLIIVNPQNGNAHFVYFLKYTINKEKLKQYSHFKVVKDAINNVADGDFGFVSPVGKNPYHSSWNTEAPISFKKRFSLSDFYEYTDIVPRKSSKTFNSNSELIDLDELIEGYRNVGIFDHLRAWSYRNYHRYKDASFNSWHAECAKVAESINNCIPRPLSANELKGIVKSVSRWVAENYTGQGLDQKEVNRGRDADVNKHLKTWTEKRILSAKITAKNKTLETMNNIIAGIESLLKKDIRPTKANLIKHEGLTAGKVYNKTYSVLFDTTDFDAAKQLILDREKAEKTAKKEARAQAKISSNTDKIKAAVKSLVASNKRVSKRAVAASAGITEKVIYSQTYSHLFNTETLSSLIKDKLRLGASKVYINNSVAHAEDSSSVFKTDSIDKIKIYTHEFNVSSNINSANSEIFAARAIEHFHREGNVTTINFEFSKDAAAKTVLENTPFEKNWLVA